MKIQNLFAILAVLVIMLQCTWAQQPQASVRQECPAVVVPCQPKQEVTEQKPTILTFYIESQTQQQQDFIEMSLTIKQKDSSLKKAIDKLTNKVNLIRALSQQHCKKYKGQDCQQRVEVNKFRVEPSYQVVRRQPNFNGFVVTHGIKIVVLETQDIGILVDGLLGLGIYQIQQLQWKPYVQVDLTQVAIDAGITKGQQLCKHINRKMGTVLSIQQVFFEDEEQDKNDDDNDPNNDQQQQDEQEQSLLQFKIECIGNESEKPESNKKSKEVIKQSKQNKDADAKGEKKKKKK